MSRGSAGVDEFVALRTDIEQARGDLVVTLGALAEKADVKAQLRRRVNDMRQRAAATIQRRWPSHPAITGTLVTLLVVVACHRTARAKR
jgi:hypothetical protein